MKNNKFANVRSYGAKGNGVSNDTQCILNAIEDMSEGGVLYFPAGDYFVDKTILFKTDNAITIKGDGWNSRILWAFDGHLFRWEDNVSCRESFFENFSVLSEKVSKSKNSSVFYSTKTERSYFSNILAKAMDRNFNALFQTMKSI